MDLIKICENTYYMQQDNIILSPKLFVIVGSVATLLIDNGNSLKQKSELNNALKRCGFNNIKYMVLTHFHKDHLGRLSDKDDLEVVPYELICSKHTGKYLSQAFSETTDMILDLGSRKLRIMEIMSTHAKGSLIVYDEDNKLVFLGDAHCPASKNDIGYYDKGKTLSMIRLLRSLDVDKYIVSHDNNDEIIDKAYFDNLYNNVLKTQGAFYYLDEE